MSDFYVKTGGLTLLFIKHHGDDSYSYVRRPYYKHSYFATWAPLVGLMKPGRCYVVAGTHKVGSSSITQTGILHELDEKDAIEMNKNFYDAVMAGEWNAKNEWSAVREQILQFEAQQVLKRLNLAENFLQSKGTI